MKKRGVLETRAGRTAPRCGLEQKILLLAHPRSGSSNIYEILQAHPALSICNEPFNEDRVRWAPGNENYSERAPDWASLQRVLQEIFSDFDGLKLLSYQLPEEWVVRLLGRADLKVIFLRRRNVLQAIVSGLISEQTQLWHRWDSNRPVDSYYAALEPLKIGVVRERVRGLAGEIARLETAIEERTPGRVLSWVYEELFFAGRARQERAMAELWAFCGVEPLRFDQVEYFLTPEQSKLNSRERYLRLPNALQIERECGCEATGHLL